MNNRILAMLLAFVMLISIVPVNALATETHDCSKNLKIERVSNGDGTHNTICNICGEVEGTYDCKYGTDSVCDNCGYVKEHTCADKDFDHLCDDCQTVAHNMTKVEAKAPNHGETGNIEYYVCGTCNNYFEDEAGTRKIEDKNSVILNKVAHTMVWTITETTHKYDCTGCGYDEVLEAEHTFGVPVSNGDGTHTKTCTITGCGYAVTEDCKDTSDCKCDACFADLEHSYEWDFGPTSHWQVCRKNNTHTTTPELHKLAGVSNGNFTHKETCEVCGYAGESVACVSNDGDCYCDVCGGIAPHDTAAMTKLSKWPNCTESGWYEHYWCETCDLRLRDGAVTTREEMFREALGHAESRWEHYEDKHVEICTRCNETVSESAHQYVFTGNGDGTHREYCETCGRDAVSSACVDENPKDCVCDECEELMPHAYEALEYIKKVEATCTNEGTKAHYKCEACGNIFSYSKGKGYLPISADILVIPATGHEIGNLSTVWEKDATCNATGLLRHYQCPTCQRLFDIDCNEITLESVTTDKLIHKWWPKGMDLSGTLHTEQCEYCKVIRFLSHKDENGDCLCDYDGCDELAHDHTAIHVPAKEATCEEEGTQEYWYYKACGKLFADEDCTQPLTHVLIYGKTAHTWGDWTGCDDGENHERLCQVCGAKETAEHVYGNEDTYCDDCGAAAGLIHFEEDPATCQKAGKKEYWYCEVTGRSYADAAGTQHITDVSSLQIPRLDHDMVAESGNGRTHTLVCDYGCGHTLTLECKTNDGNCFCDVCGAVVSGHNLEVIEFIAPTCTTKGQVSASYCAECDKYYDTFGNVIYSTVIPALGHHWSSSWKVNSVDETYEKTCRNGCGEILVHEHSMVLEDTLKGNLHQWVCDCGYTKTEIHYDNDGDTACDECGHDMANKPLKVEQHSSETVIVGDKTTANNRNTWWQDWWEHLFPGNVGQDGMENVDSSSNPKASGETAKKNTITTSGNSGNSGSQAGSTGSVSENVETEQKVDVITSLIQWLSNLLNSLRNG